MYENKLIINLKLFAMKKLYLFFLVIAGLLLEAGLTSLFAQDILFLTRTDWKDANGFYADSMYLVALEEAGYDVDLVYDDFTNVDTDEDIEELVNADLIILGRGISSGDFNAENDDDYIWAKVQTPIILMSNYVARSSRLRWFASTNSKQLAREAPAGFMGKVLNPEDSAFINITVPAADSIITYGYDDFGMLELDGDAISRINGEVLMTLAPQAGQVAYKINRKPEDSYLGDTLDTYDLEADYADIPIMVRFEPGELMYDTTGYGPSVIPNGWRTFMPTGHDDDVYIEGTDTLRLYNYNILSDDMKQVLVDEVAYLINRPVPDLDDDNTLSSLTVSEGTLSPAFDSETTQYSITLSGDIDSILVTAEANSPLAEILASSDTGWVQVDQGSATVSVRAENFIVKKYVIAILQDATLPAGSKSIQPGLATINLAVQTASDGDTIYLANGFDFIPVTPVEIDKSLVIIAEEIPELPGLENMPVIKNSLGITPVIQLTDGADLVLIGVDVDARGQQNVISAREEAITVESIYINRCRLHGSSADIMQDANRDHGTVLNNCHVMNTFVYDGGSHGIYIKHFNSDGSTDYVFENLTYWNLGEQFNWLRHYPETVTQTFVFDHLTGYNLSTNADQNKELWGNSDEAGEASLDITLKNSILSSQQSTESSLMFNNTSGNHSITINDCVLHDVNALGNSGTVTESNLITDQDPQFEDPDNGDFTVNNSALHTAADDGEILGALYWMPGFVDDFSDVSPEVGINDKLVNSLTVGAYPNPVVDKVTFEFITSKAGWVEIEIYDISGALVNEFDYELPLGKQKLEVDASKLEAGSYFYTIRENNNSGTGLLIKAGR